MPPTDLIPPMRDGIYASRTVKNIRFHILKTELSFFLEILTGVRPLSNSARLQKYIGFRAKTDTTTLMSIIGVRVIDFGTSGENISPVSMRETFCLSQKKLGERR